MVAFRYCHSRFFGGLDNRVGKYGENNNIHSCTSGFLHVSKRSRFFVHKLNPLTIFIPSTKRSHANMIISNKALSLFLLICLSLTVAENKRTPRGIGRDTTLHQQRALRVLSVGPRDDDDDDELPSSKGDGSGDSDDDEDEDGMVSSSKGSKGSSSSDDEDDDEVSASSSSKGSSSKGSSSKGSSSSDDSDDEDDDEEEDDEDEEDDDEDDDEDDEDEDVSIKLSFAILTFSLAFLHRIHFDI